LYCILTRVYIEQIVQSRSATVCMEGRVQLTCVQQQANPHITSMQVLVLVGLPL